MPRNLAFLKAVSPSRRMVGWVAIGAGEGILTLDPNLGKVVDTCL
jgi:hypothetical protein